MAAIAIAIGTGIATGMVGATAPVATAPDVTVPPVTPNRATARDAIPAASAAAATAHPVRLPPHAPKPPVLKHPAVMMVLAAMDLAAMVPVVTALAAMSSAPSRWNLGPRAIPSAIRTASRARPASVPAGADVAAVEVDVTAAQTGLPMGKRATAWRTAVTAAMKLVAVADGPARRLHRAARQPMRRPCRASRR